MTSCNERSYMISCDERSYMTSCNYERSYMTSCKMKGSTCFLGQCRCHMGYVGVDCQECLTLPGCRHGTCQRSFECNCDAGYTGMYCSEALCDDGCDLERGYCDAPAGTCRYTGSMEGRRTPPGGFRPFPDCKKAKGQ